jgi:hypothetical protein
MSQPDWTVRGSKRFSTENQILQEINKCHENSKRSLEKAEAIDLQIRQARENPPANVDADQLSQMIRDLKIKAKMFRTYATNQVEKKARKLGVKLSEMRTTTMPFLSDASIPRRLR